MDRFDLAGKAFADLCRIMAKLRAPGGCPWDQEQTIASLKPYLLEEVYETLDAMESGTPETHCEELGDLLLQIVFQAEITQETSFNISNIVDGISEKLIRRHPHVFGGDLAASASEAIENWESIKATERPRNKGLLDSVPNALPALLKAYRTGEKVSGVGFDWPAIEGPRAKVIEEWEEVNQAITKEEPKARIESEIGDLLFAIVNYSRHLQIDPESALNSTTKRFQKRFRYVEKALANSNKRVSDVSLSALNILWEEAKINSESEL